MPYPQFIPYPTSGRLSTKSSTIPSPTLTSNIFGAKCSPSPGKKLPGKNPVRRAFKKIQIQMIADSFWPTKRRAVPSAPELDGHVTPCWVLQSNLRLLYGNHQEISDLRNLRRFRAPEQRSPLTC